MYSFYDLYLNPSNGLPPYKLNGSTTIYDKTRILSIYVGRLGFTFIYHLQVLPVSVKISIRYSNFMHGLYKIFKIVSRSIIRHKSVKFNRIIWEEEKGGKLLKV